MEIGKYTTVGVKLGQGAFGTVELATDGKKQVAIKCIEKKHIIEENMGIQVSKDCLLYTSPSPRDGLLSRMPSSA